MPVKSTEDLDHLVRLVGPEAARAALRKDIGTAVGVLLDLVKARRLEPPRKPTRVELIELLLGGYEHRISQTAAEFSALPESAIAKELNDSGCSRGELMNFLQRAGIPFAGGLSKKQLIDEAAHALSRLGVYQRISGA